MNLFEKVRDVIAESLSCDVSLVTEGADLGADLGADSLAVVELIMALEDNFSITIGEESIKGAVTVGDVVKLVAELS